MITPITDPLWRAPWSGQRQSGNIWAGEFWELRATTCGAEFGVNPSLDRPALRLSSGSVNLVLTAEEWQRLRDTPQSLSPQPDLSGAHVWSRARGELTISQSAGHAGAAARNSNTMTWSWLLSQACGQATEGLQQHDAEWITHMERLSAVGTLGRGLELPSALMPGGRAVVWDGHLIVSDSSEILICSPDEPSWREALNTARGRRLTGATPVSALAWRRRGQRATCVPPSPALRALLRAAAGQWANLESAGHGLKLSAAL